MYTRQVLLPSQQLLWASGVSQPSAPIDHIESADFWQLRFLQMAVSTIPINPIPLILKHPP